MHKYSPFVIIISMNNLRQTFSYLFGQGRGKRFIVLFLLLLIPCAILAYFLPLGSFVDFFTEYSSTGFSDWGSLYLSVFDFSVYTAIGLPVAFILFIFCLAYVATLITRHVHVGEFTLPKILYSVNENFFPALAFILFLTVITALSHLFFSLFAFTFMQISSRAFGLVLSIIALILLYLALICIVSPTTLWLPVMSFTGLYVGQALASAYYKSRRIAKSLIVPLFVISATVFAVSTVIRLTHIWYIEWIVNTLTYTTASVTYVTFAMLSYCDVESVKREDLAKKFFGR